MATYPPFGDAIFDCITFLLSLCVPSRSTDDPARFSELYEYDGVQRLKKFHRGELVDDNSVITAPTLQQGWQLDATGNWVNFTQGNPATPGEALDQQRAHNTVNEITDIARTVGANWVTPQHDRNGNTTLLPQPHDPTAGYTTTWDAWNRMVTVSDTLGVVQTNTYDGLVRRISQATASGTERYYYTASWQTLEEHTGSPAALKRRYLWGLRYIDDLVLQDRDPTGTDNLTQRSYALQDALFNVVALAQPNALLRERYAYTAYGRPLFLDADFEPHAVQESVVDERYLFTGRRLDAVTGLYYYRMRFYDWGLGRFLGRDPSGYVDGINWYQYSGSSPVVRVDAYGLASCYVELGQIIQDYSDFLWERAQNAEGPGVPPPRLKIWGDGAARQARDRVAGLFSNLLEFTKQAQGQLASVFAAALAHLAEIGDRRVSIEAAAEVYENGCCCITSLEPPTVVGALAFEVPGPFAIARNLRFEFEASYLERTTIRRCDKGKGSDDEGRVILHLTLKTEGLNFIPKTTFSVPGSIRYVVPCRPEGARQRPCEKVVEEE